MRVRVLFVITALGTGGAERQLARLASALRSAGFTVSVVALRGGPVENDLREAEVPVVNLDVQDLVRGAGAIGKLVCTARSFKPDVIQGWMHHGNLAAYLAWMVGARRARLYWGVRQSLYAMHREKRLTRWIIRMGARFSAHVDGIIYNSEVARAQHEGIGYAAGRSMVIDNGFDLTAFRPNADDYLAVRQELGVLPDTPLIGLIARFHPMKGHQVFLQAAAKLAEANSYVHFLLAGTDVTPENPVLKPWLTAPRLVGRLHLLGERKDVARLTAALDIASSASSWGEGFSNAMAEAMCCSVPCVATDVGDVRRIVGEAGIVVPVGDAEALARAWQSILALSPDARRQLGQAGRARVEQNFSLERVAAQYAEVYRRAQ